MAEFKKAGVGQGMITMVQDGLLKALEGITDVEEVFRVAGEN
jgi:type II secretory ATPase GspE/PulE/Tfp pilus assembly ATPase PilB-like protein